MAVVAWIGVPVVDDSARNALVVWVNRSFCTLAPVLVACEAVGEDLVDDRVLVPGGQNLALAVVHGNLERRRNAIGKGALTHLAALAGAVTPDIAVGRRDVERVPQDVGLFGRIRDGKADAAIRNGFGRALHGNELLVSAVLLCLVLNPQMKLRRSLGLIPDVNGKRDRLTQRQGAEGHTVALARCYMSGSHDTCASPCRQ